MLIDATYVSEKEFNKVLTKYKGRIVTVSKPTTLCWDLCIYEDTQGNIHALYKDFDNNL